MGQINQCWLQSYFVIDQHCIFMVIKHSWVELRWFEAPLTLSRPLTRSWSYDQNWRSWCPLFRWCHCNSQLECLIHWRPRTRWLTAAENDINGLVQDCSNSSALALELLQSSAKPSIGQNWTNITEGRTDTITKQNQTRRNRVYIPQYVLYHIVYNNKGRRLELPKTRLFIQ